jgi:hypothetical protein
MCTCCVCKTRTRETQKSGLIYMWAMKMIQPYSTGAVLEQGTLVRENSPPTSHHCLGSLCLVSVLLASSRQPSLLITPTNQVLSGLGSHCLLLGSLSVLFMLGLSLRLQALWDWAAWGLRPDFLPGLCWESSTCHRKMCAWTKGLDLASVLLCVHPVLYN